MTPDQYVATLRQRFKPLSYTEVEIALWVLRELAGVAEVMVLQALGRWPVPDYPITTDSRQVPVEASR